MPTVLYSGLHWYNVHSYNFSRVLFNQVKHIGVKRYSSYRVLHNMNEAFIEFDKNEDKFECSLHYVNPNLMVNRVFNFSRRAQEPIEKFLSRIQFSILSMSMKKLKRRKGLSDTTIPDILKMVNIQDDKVVLIKNGQELDKNLSCSIFLNDTDSTKLVIYGIEYELIYNSSKITRIDLPTHIMATFPVYPIVFESKNITREDCNFVWYKSNNKNIHGRWAEIAAEYYFTPANEHIGYYLKLCCKPKDNSTHTCAAVEVVSTATVGAGPGLCPFEKRHKFTQNKLVDNEFRVVTYNILADMYSDSKLSKGVLYPYCPSHALQMDYRKFLILKELLGFNADVICLQEVDSKVYHRDLDVILSYSEFEGIFKTKPGVNEGLAIFFDKRRFTKLNEDHCVLSESVTSEKFHKIWSQIKTEKTKEVFEQRPTIVQSIVLRSKEDVSKILLVANTHLYFRPDADNIRLLQAYSIVTYLESKLEKIKEQNPNCQVGIIFCGDFNSSPKDGVFKLLTENYVSPDSDDWISDVDETVKENISLQQDMRYGSACGTPEYTNYTVAFAGCLDYIFYAQDHFNVSQVVPMPTIEELTEHTALPSPVFPSDHVSLCADLKWIT